MAWRGEGGGKKTQHGPRHLLLLDRSSSPSFPIPSKVSGPNDKDHTRSPQSKHAILYHTSKRNNQGDAPDYSGIQNKSDKDIVQVKDEHSSPRAASPGPGRRSKPYKPAPLNIGLPAKAATPESSVSSQSRARWEHLRQHVLPTPIRPSTPPVHSHQSFPVIAQSLLPPRVQTPKPSRFARLGFRQVVEDAREAAVDERRKFALELQKICWAIRVGEPQKGSKTDREPTTIGSSLYMPFMSSTSLATTEISASNNQSRANDRAHDIRRPQSVQSMALAYRQAPSLRPLYQTLFHHGTPVADGLSLTSNLPHESQVLSTLLSPFLTSEGGAHIDEEKWNAIEAFEIITRSWAPFDEIAGVERCLWCCKAAVMPPSKLRTRVLSLLWGLVIPKESNYSATTPGSFQALAGGLFSILPSVPSHAASVADREEGMLLNDIINQVRSGCCGELDKASVEAEYNVNFSTNDNSDLIREELLLGALAKCLEECADDARLWLIQNSLEPRWVMHPGVSFTPVLTAICARKLNSVGRALLKLLSASVNQESKSLRTKCAARLLRTRIIPEIEAIGETAISELGSNVVKIVIELICMSTSREPTRWSIMLICQWYRERPAWKSSLEKVLQNFIAMSDWSTVLWNLSSLIKFLPDDARKPLAAFVLPLLYDRMVEDLPVYPCLPLTTLFDTISRLYPQIFYKPIFSCAASSKEFTVVNHLCVIVAVSKFLPDFWIRDAEMMSVALMSDVGGDRGATLDMEGKPTWGRARLGQSILLLELIGQIQAMRHDKEMLSSSDSFFHETVKFVLALESRLGILLDAKEQTALVPPSQRLLFSVLFREIRLLTRSLRAAIWLPRIVSWFIDIHLDDDISIYEIEQKNAVNQIQGLYAAAQDGVRPSHKRRTTILLPSATSDKQYKLDASSQSNTDLASIFASKAGLLMSLSKGFVAKAMKLLVTMSALLTASDYRRLGPILWENVQSDGDSSLTTSVSFLVMQCAEKTPLDLLAIMEIDLQSSYPDTKMNAIRKIGILSNWRFQILSQHVIADRARRPFKLARGPLPFVATDMGSSVYVPEDDPNELKDNFPSELRKRLAEMGWDQEDKPVDQQLEWIKTPMSLLATSQLDRLDNSASDQQVTSPSSPNMSASPTSLERPDDDGLLRRNSSTGGPIYNVKRRAVFVPSLALIFPRLASLVFDSNFAVASAARNTVVDLMRNDPALLTRPVLDLLIGDQKDMHSAISIINAFLHMQRVLPPPMAHHLFNNLAGFLKYAARHAEGDDALRDFAHTIPILARLVTQVSGMSIREIRRSKVEIFLIPSGSLWFSSLAPPGPMFPRNIVSTSISFDGLPPPLVAMTIIRLSQNMLFLTMLKRNRQDVQLIRKNMTRLILPSTEYQTRVGSLELADFVPFKSRRAGGGDSLRGLSLMLSHSYLLLVAQVFRSMPRHLNDRDELAILIDGLNRILLAHGDDIGIVSQVLIALMVASTRFRRLFTSGGSYGLFMPAIVKIYTESESHAGIKLAVEYAVNRFYALHKEAFVFQTLDTIAHIVMLPDIEVDWLIKSVYNLFFSLQRGIPPGAPDAAGIHNSNKLQEREALIVSTAEEKPQTFLALLRRGDSQTGDQVTIDLPEEYETSRLGIDDFVRLFLTVIAHDPSIVRAEQFLRLFRLLVPHLYHASASARSVLQDGIDALGVVLAKASTKPKSADSPLSRATNEGEEFLFSETLPENRLLEKSQAASDITSMRIDYLSLIVAFTRTGGQLPQPAAQRAIDLVKIVLKDSPIDLNNAISKFLADFTRTSLLRETPSLKRVVSFLLDLGPLISTYAAAVNFTGVFEVTAVLVANPLYANEPSFSRVVVRICAAGLAAFELAATEKFPLSLPCRSSLVNLIGQAVLLRGADVILELEKQPPSYAFLAGIVLPLVMTLKTGSELASDGTRAEAWHPNLLTTAWIRLLSYSMSASQYATGSSRFLNRSKSQDKSRSTDPKQSQISAFVIALQVLKVIAVRAEADLSSRLPGVWSRIASFLKSVLAEGDARFSTPYRNHSPTPSPTHSPTTSRQFDRLPPSMSADLRSPPSFSSPRIVDYSLWSVLELLCVYRNPLVLQMRLFMVEKIVELNQELRHQQEVHGSMDPTSRRASASVFSKPRRRLSGLPSPTRSPRLSPSQSFQHDTSLSSFEGRQAGYRFLASPTSHNTHGPKIVHLGPISPGSAFGRSPSGKEMHATPRATKIKSMTLIRATYRRIRTVQSFMGYDTLLPMPPSHELNMQEVFTTTWTKKQALDAISRETRELVEEFDESDGGLEDDAIADAKQFQSY